MLEFCFISRHKRNDCLRGRIYDAAMSIYVELVLFNNFAVDALLEACTLAAMRRKGSKIRCALAAAVGAMAATLYAIAPKGWQIAIKVLLAPIMTAIFFKPKQGKPLARFLDLVGGSAVFVVFTFLAGGATMGMSYLLGVDVAGYWTFGLVAGALAICVVACRAIIKRRSGARKDIRAACICSGGERIECRALCDSGNLLVDSFSGLPVVIISNAISGNFAACEREGFIDVNSAAGSDCMPLVRLDSVEVDGKSMKALGAISKAQLAGFDVILQASMF